MTDRIPFKFLPLAVFAIVLFAPLISGCLTADKKEVHLTLNDDGRSGSGKIVFTGIASTPGDSASAIDEDFNTLIAEYYQGRKIELAYPGMKNVRKKLAQKNGKLMGEIDFDFDDVSDLGIYRYKDSGPYMYYTVSEGFLTSGQYQSSNGTYLGDKFPIIFWDSSERDLSYTMSLTTQQEPKKPLLAEYERWQAGQH
ncbi:MAG TPA: hypothetical protein VFH95_13115 [Candidatus Kapabacteria bacterium]|nr:hypothetical protein [Candidatus Kapabacteria bacterium]